ncbi:MAG TPA: hypothetical protein VGH17_08775 [Candidatus Acidoferrales bacterium]|jgi:hypothetical protein
MTEIETRKLLLQLAQLLRAHFEYLHTLHDSTIALFDVLRKKNPEIETLYRQHPLVRSQHPQGQTAEEMLRSIDGLIELLK